MSENVRIQINGRWIEVPAGIGVAAALYAADQFCFRKAEWGEPRAALCGMGICFECRLTIDRKPNCRSCQMIVRDGMVIETT